MKTKVYNLIILDESGSMSCVTKQTINGCNETINTIKSTQQKHDASQEHYVSIYAFQSNDNVPSRYLVKNIPASAAEHISDSDYSPWGGTPLYDAVGSCLAELKLMANKGDDVLASVTIITDGEENSSTQYTQHKVRAMISQLKELGWNFTFIGANIDVKATARALDIDED
ncbi:MAG: VWA domain-containing protein, partial [Muribaculaceae bacterium]|nr:VWA domain-containing protein [Muribaculaceae bacterium]